MRRHHGLWVSVLGLLAAGAGCSQTQRGYAIPNASVSLPPMELRREVLKRAGAPAEPLAVATGGSQLLLVHCTTMTDRYYEYRRWHRAFVIVLDTPVARGRMEITPENGRLIENAPWAPVRQPYIGLDGEINVLSVSADGVLADCSVHSRIRNTGEPVYSLRGLYLFKVGQAPPGELAQCGIGAAP